MLSTIYGDRYTNSPAQSNVASLAFAGTVVGQLFFGWVSDHYSRKWALMASTIILIVFAALSAGSYGAGGSVEGMLAVGLFGAFSALETLTLESTTGSRGIQVSDRYRYWVCTSVPKKKG